MRLGLAKRITLEHIEPIGCSAGAPGRRGAAEKRDTCVLKRLRITLKADPISKDPTNRFLNLSRRAPPDRRRLRHVSGRLVLLHPELAG